MVIDNPYSNNSKHFKHFYECPESLSKPIHVKYQVLDTEVLVGYRPNIVLHEDDAIYAMNVSLYNSIDSFINVGDNFVGHRADKLSGYFPFNEAGSPTIETVCAALETLDYQIRVLRLKRIYIHCDLGSHRAPTIFGMYLFAFHPRTIKQIVANHERVNLRPIEWSNPRNYLRSYLNKETFYLYTFLRNLRNNKKKTTSLEGMLNCQNNSEIKKMLFNERNWESISQTYDNPFFGTIRYGKQMIESLRKEFVPSLDSLYFKKIKSPLIRLKIDLNIALGTNRGKGWEKAGFGTKNEKKHREKQKKN